MHALLLAALLAVGEPTHDDLFVSGKDGYHTFRIPSLIFTSKGTMLAFCEGRKKGRGDSGDIDLVLKRSTDGGKTWSRLTVLVDDGDNTVGNPCPVIERSTGTIWLLLTHNLGKDTERAIRDGTSKGTRSVWVMKSTDDGQSWTKPVDITKDTKDPNWTWYATGPGVGIQMHSGRLVIPCDHTTAETKANRSHVIYSDDKGATWKRGSALGTKTNECQVVELEDGKTLLLNMRSYHGKNRRAIATSKDGGETWSEVKLDDALLEPICQASLIAFRGQGRARDHLLLFSNPASTKREKLTVRLSRDGGKTWPVSKELHAGPAAYSCLAEREGTVWCLYERGEKSAYERISLAKFSLGWLGKKE